MGLLDSTIAGGTAGSTLGPWGALAGAGVGALSSFMGADDTESATEAQLAAQQAAIAKAQGNVNNTVSTLKDMYNPYISAGANGINALQSGDYTAAQTAFHPETDVSKFLDPSMKFQEQQAQRGLEQGAAAGNSLYSGAQQKALTDRMQSMGQTFYQNAFNNMQNSNQMNENVWQQTFDQALNNANQRFKQNYDTASIGSNAANSFANNDVNLQKSLNDMTLQGGVNQGGINAAPYAADAAKWGAVSNFATTAPSAYNNAVLANNQNNLYNNISDYYKINGAF